MVRNLVRNGMRNVERRVRTVEILQLWQLP
jgi:hypothetical protein